MIIQNILVFISLPTISSFIALPLTIDIVTIALMAILSVFIGIQQKTYKISIGGGLLLIWIILSLVWRQAFGVYSGKIELCIPILGTTCPNYNKAFGLLSFGSFFLGFGLYLIFNSMYDTKIGNLKLVIILYAISNIIGSILYIIFIIKVVLVPFLAILMYYMLYKGLQKGSAEKTDKSDSYYYYGDNLKEQ